MMSICASVCIVISHTADVEHLCHIYMHIYRILVHKCFILSLDCACLWDFLNEIKIFHAFHKPFNEDFNRRRIYFN